MVFVLLDRPGFIGLQEGLKKRGILISGREKVRLVTHMDVTTDDIRTVIQAVKDYFSGHHT
jgi:threonine aldolase